MYRVRDDMALGVSGVLVASATCLFDGSRCCIMLQHVACIRIFNFPVFDENCVYLFYNEDIFL